MLLPVPYLPDPESLQSGDKVVGQCTALITTEASVTFSIASSAALDCQETVTCFHLRENLRRTLQEVRSGWLYRQSVC